MTAKRRSSEKSELIREAKKVKDPARVAELVRDYTASMELPVLDEARLGRILQKADRERSLRVAAFKLERSHYDALSEYFEGAAAEAREAAPLGADELVRRTIEEFVEQIS